MRAEPRDSNPNDVGAMREGFPDASADARRFKRAALVAFLLILAACSWFFSVGHVNQISRYDAIFAFYRNSGENAWTFRIDDQFRNTADWAFCNGHYYSNKSPGTTLFGAVVLAPIQAAKSLCFDSDSARRFNVFDAWLLNWILSVLPVALSFFAFLGIFRMLDLSETRSLFGAVLCVLGTAMFPYSTTLFAHATVAAFLVWSLFFGMRAARGGVLLDLAASGACFGLAALFDYSALILLPAIAIAALVRFKTRSLWFFAGGVPFALAYCIYNWMCFGNPFSFAFQYNNPAFVTKNAFGGALGVPSLQALLELMIGARRGVFSAMPFLLFAPFGAIRLWKDGRRGLTILLSACVALLFLMNASFNGWHGGATTLARYLIPILPALGTFAVASPLKRLPVRWLFLLFALLSCFNMLATAQYTTTAHEGDPSPLYGSAHSTMFDAARPPTLQTGLDGEPLWLKPDPEKAESCAFSLGEKLGMNRAVSLVCLMTALGAAMFALVFLRRRGFVEFFFAPMKQWRNLLPKKSDAFPALLCAAAFVSVLLWPGSVGWPERDAAALNDMLVAGARGMEFKPFEAVRLLNVQQAFWRFFLLFSFDALLIAALKTVCAAFAILWAARKLHAEAKRSGWILFAFFLFAFPAAGSAIRALSLSSLSIAAALCGMILLVKFFQTGRVSAYFASLVIFLLTAAASPCGLALAVAALLSPLIRTRFLRNPLHQLGFLILFVVFGACGAAFCSSAFNGKLFPAEASVMFESALRPFTLSSFDSVFPMHLEMREDSYPNGFGWGAFLSFFMLALGVLLALAGAIHAVRRWFSARDDVWASLRLFALLSFVLTLVFSAWFGQAGDSGAFAAALPCLALLETGGVGYLDRRIEKFKICFYAAALLLVAANIAVAFHFAQIRAADASLAPNLAEQHCAAQKVNSLLERSGAGRWMIENAPGNETGLQTSLNALVKLDALRTPRWNLTNPGRVEPLRIRMAHPGETARLSVEAASCGD